MERTRKTKSGVSTIFGRVDRGSYLPRPLTDPDMPD